MTNKRELAREIFSKCSLTGVFSRADGELVDGYFDKYMIHTDPDLLSGILDLMCKLVPSECELLVGTELGGALLSSGLSLRTGIPSAILRREPILYGTKKELEGVFTPGTHAILVEDTITTGRSLSRSCDHVRNVGLELVQVLCAVDRSGEDAAIDAACGVPVVAAIVADDLTPVKVIQRGLLPPEAIAFTIE